MSINKVTDGGAQVGRLVFGGPGAVGGRLTGVLTGTVSVTAPTTLAADTKTAVNVTITGVRAGDVVYLEPNAALENRIVVQSYAVSANDTVTIQFYNPHTAAAGATSARNWSYTVIRTS